MTKRKVYNPADVESYYLDAEQYTTGSGGTSEGSGDNEDLG